MEEDKRKEIINHFIKFFIYDLKHSNNNKVYIENIELDISEFLTPYIKDKHYLFSPFLKMQREDK